MRAVVTGRDVEMGYYGIDLQDQRMFALDKVRFIGEPIAAVRTRFVPYQEAARERFGAVMIIERNTCTGCMGELASTFIEEASAENLETECISNMKPSPFFLSLTGPQP